MLRKYRGFNPIMAKIYRKRLKECDNHNIQQYFLPTPDKGVYTCRVSIVNGPFYQLDLFLTIFITIFKSKMYKFL